jgi:single-strand DNA-binding protein
MSITPTTIVGNLTADPELTFTTGGAAKLSFSIAANSSWEDKDGNKQDKTSYFNVIAWGYLAENSANVLEKGMGVVVVGTLDQRSWEDKDSGQKRSTVEVKAMEVGIRTGSLESVERRRASGGDSSSKPTPPRTKQTVPADEPF